VLKVAKYATITTKAKARLMPLLERMERFVISSMGDVHYSIFGFILWSCFHGQSNDLVMPFPVTGDTSSFGHMVVHFI
jgi:hypothetical protein